MSITLGSQMFATLHVLTLIIMLKMYLVPVCLNALLIVLLITQKEDAWMFVLELNMLGIIL